MSGRRWRGWATASVPGPAYLVSGMTLTSIGKTFDVTQQTISRWLAAARADVLTRKYRAR